MDLYILFQVWSKTTSLEDRFIKWFFCLVCIIYALSNHISYWQVEIKNLNSFSSMGRAIDFEISRQVQLHSQGQGDLIAQETRLWEEGAQVIVTSYLYFIQ